MIKKVVATIKLQIVAGKATPSPPIGPALGQHGVNIMEFCKKYNEITKNQEGLIIPVLITIYNDRSFSFITKTPPASILLKQAAKIVKGSSNVKQDKVASISKKEINEIAKLKISDLNTIDINKAIKIIEGTAHSMGIEVQNE